MVGILTMMPSGIIYVGSLVHYGFGLSKFFLYFSVRYFGGVKIFSVYKILSRYSRGVIQLGPTTSGCNPLCPGARGGALE